MNTRYLLSHRWKRPAWIALLFFLACGVIHAFVWELDFPFLHWRGFNLFPGRFFPGAPASSHWIDVNITNTLLGMGIIVSALLAGFSAELREDEYVASMRLSALSWAVIVNYLLLLLAFLLFYDLSFFVAMEYNLFTTLLLFVFRFRYLLYRSGKNLPDEK